MLGKAGRHIGAHAQVAVPAADLAGLVQRVDLGLAVRLVDLVVHIGTQRQAVAGLGRLVGVAHHQAGDREHRLGQLQELGNRRRLVQRRAHIADAQAAGLEGQGHRLRQDDGVEGRHHEAVEVGLELECESQLQINTSSTSSGLQRESQTSYLIL